MSLKESLVKEYNIRHSKLKGQERNERWKYAKAPIALNKSIDRHSEKLNKTKSIKKSLEKYKK